MKMKKFWMIVCMIAAFLFLFAGCGNQASADDEEDPTTMETAEKVTEFDKDQTSLTFADIENGINLKRPERPLHFDLRILIRSIIH